MKDITYFARINFRGSGRLFGIRRGDRLSHMYAIGKTGTGKSTLFETLMRQDLENGEGFALLDPHGDLFDKVNGEVPKVRRDSVTAWDVTDPASAIRFNPLSGVEPEKRSLAVAGLIAAFERQWHVSWGVTDGARLEEYTLCSPRRGRSNPRGHSPTPRSIQLSPRGHRPRREQTGPGFLRERVRELRPVDARPSHRK
jgi:hypothetical protein